MTKWEYMYVIVAHEWVTKINGHRLAEYKGFWKGYEDGKNIPASKFLEDSGQEGWEEVGDYFVVDRD